MSRQHPTPRAIHYIAYRSVPRPRHRIVEALTFASEVGVVVLFGFVFAVGLPLMAAAMR